MEQTAVIKDQYSRVLEKIHDSAISIGRSPQSIQLIVVTKAQPVAVFTPLAELGVKRVGENYVEEVILKQSDLSGKSGFAWHMIGHIQSRKAQSVIAHLDFVHSLDSLKLAKHLDHYAQEANKVMPVLLECNTSGETSKFGWPASNEDQWEQLLSPIMEISQLKGLKISGLMTMAPFSERAEDSRPFFQRLKQMAYFIHRQLPGIDLSELSMGMSSDYEVAIQEGATMVRIGQAILGKRPG